MKKHISISFLALKPVFYKMLGLFGLSAAVQTFLYQKALHQGIDYAAQSLADYNALYVDMKPLWRELEQWPAGYYSFSEVIRDAGLQRVFLGTLLLLALLLYMSQREAGAIHRYTLSRLSVDRKWIFVNWSLCYALCFLALLAFETLLCMAFGLWYEQTALGAAAGPQALFLGFYQSEFLHGLLPMADLFFWLRSLLWCLCLGVCAAFFSAKLRNTGKISFAALFPLGLVCMFWDAQIGDWNTHITVTIFMLITTISALFRGAEGGASDEK